MATVKSNRIGMANNCVHTCRLRRLRIVVLQSTHRRCALRYWIVLRSVLSESCHKYALCLNTHPSLSLSCSLSVFLRILAALAVYDVCIAALSHVLTTNSLRSLRIVYLCNVLPMVSSCNVSQICGPSSQYMHTHTYAHAHVHAHLCYAFMNLSAAIRKL